MQQQQVDPYNSIETSAFAEAQAKKAIMKGERRYGIFESMTAVENMRDAIKRRYKKHGGAYDFAALAVLDDVIGLLSSMEQRATRDYDYHAWLWQQEVERVKTQVLPVQGKR